MNPELTMLKENAEREASKPSEHVAVINRAELMGTLQSAWEMSKKMERSKEAGAITILIERPQIYSSAKLKDLSPRACFSAN